MEQISYTYAASIVHKRPSDSNKGTFGRLLCVCGCAVPGQMEAGSQMAGAAIFCGGAALRCGAGLVEMSIPHGIYPAVASALPLRLRFNERAPASWAVVCQRFTRSASGRFCRLAVFRWCSTPMASTALPGMPSACSGSTASQSHPF